MQASGKLFFNSSLLVYVFYKQFSLTFSSLKAHNLFFNSCLILYCMRQIPHSTEHSENLL